MVDRSSLGGASASRSNIGRARNDVDPAERVDRALRTCGVAPVRHGHVLIGWTPDTCVSFQIAADEVVARTMTTARRGCSTSSMPTSGQGFYAYVCFVVEALRSSDRDPPEASLTRLSMLLATAEPGDIERRVALAFRCWSDRTARDPLRRRSSFERSAELCAALASLRVETVELFEEAVHAALEPR